MKTSLETLQYIIIHQEEHFLLLIYLVSEGTYILRNLNHGTKWIDGQKTWFEMRDDIDNASSGFTTPRDTKKQIKQKNSERYQREVGSIADRWVKEKESGASQDILDSISKEYNAASDKFRKELEIEVRSALALNSITNGSKLMHRITDLNMNLFLQTKE